MRKLILLTSIVCLLMASIVLADVTLKQMSDEQGYVTTDDSEAFYYKYDLSVEVDKGWNVISTFNGPAQILPGSEISASNIKSVYYYSPLQKEYVNWLSIMGGDSELPIWWDSNDANIANGGSTWVYSNKKGTLKYWADDYKQRRILVNGWNFIALTPEMAKQQSNGLYTFPVNFEESGCKVRKVFLFESNKQSWTVVPEFANGGNAIGPEYMGLGLLMKIETNNEQCVWTPQGETVTAPPSLPN